jgi:hypothetical protein
MSKRKVTLKLTTQKDLIETESSARTFGELQKEMTNVEWSGMRVVVRSTKNTLQDDNALLPAEDFVLFLVPEKVKSGVVEKLKNISTATYNDLRSHISYLNKMKKAGLPSDGGTEQLRKVVQSYYDTKNPAKGPVIASKSTSVEKNSRIVAIEEARIKINEAIDVIIANAGEAKTVEDTTEYLIKVSLEDLDKEILELKKSLSL